VIRQLSSLEKKCFVTCYSKDQELLIGHNRKLTTANGLGIIELDGRRYEIEQKKANNFTA
jgi:hypothetical protein